MAFTQEDLDALDQAIASGELTVAKNGQSITYRSVSELIRARDKVAAAMAAAESGRPGGVFKFRFTTGRGD